MKEQVNKEKEFSEEEIRFLPPRDAVRLRTSMYLGSVEKSDVMIREIIDNSCDEISEGFGDTILISNNFNGFCFVADNGRGLPITMSKDKPGITQAELSMSELHSGSKFEGSNTLARIGEHGLGQSAVCFTSNIFIVLSKITEFNYDRTIPPVKELWENAGPRSKKDLFYILVYEEGLKVFEGAGKLKDLEKKIFKGIKNYVSIPEGQSTITLFKPDPKIWENCTPEIPMTNLQYFLLIQEKFYKKKVNVVVDGVNLRSTFNPYKFEFAKTIVPKDTSSNKQVGLYVTFEVDPNLGNAQVFGSVNGLSVDEGVHINLGKNLYKQSLKSYFGIKHDYLLNGLKMVIIVLANEVQYNSQTKENLKQITKVKPADFDEILKDFQRIFKKNEDYWEVHTNKLNLLAESFKNITAIDKAKKMIDSGSGVSLYRSKNDLVPGFVDATSTDRSKCSLWIVEGLSPASSLVNSRINPLYDSILPLKGKILNVMDKSADQALDNKEIYSIFSAIKLGIDAESVIKDCKTKEEAMDRIMKKSRFSKIIISCDPDPDGAFISNSILYLFSKFARFLIDFGLVYSVEVPVFIQEQRGAERFFYPSDPVIPGTILPVGMDLNKKYVHIKGLGGLSREQVQKVFFDPNTRRLIRITPERMDRARELTENIIERKKLLIESGIISNPFNFTDL